MILSRRQRARNASLIFSGICQALLLLGTLGLYVSYCAQGSFSSPETAAFTLIALLVGCFLPLAVAVRLLSRAIYNV